MQTAKKIITLLNSTTNDDLDIAIDTIVCGLAEFGEQYEHLMCWYSHLLAQYADYWDYVD